jgi:hypothetical protein
VGWQCFCGVNCWLCPSARFNDFESDLPLKATPKRTDRFTVYVEIKFDFTQKDSPFRIGYFSSQKRVFCTNSCVVRLFTTHWRLPSLKTVPNSNSPRFFEIPEKTHFSTKRENLTFHLFWGKSRKIWFLDVKAHVLFPEEVLYVQDEFANILKNANFHAQSALAFFFSNTKLSVSHFFLLLNNDCHRQTHRHSHRHSHTHHRQSDRSTHPQIDTIINTSTQCHRDQHCLQHNHQHCQRCHRRPKPSPLQLWHHAPPPLAQEGTLFAVQTG